jgi:DNA helicase-2/ATP-dependent DNA helicase PcrA
LAHTGVFGWLLGAPEAEQYQKTASDVLAEHGLPKQLAEGFENVNRQPDGTPTSSELGLSVVIDFWERLQKKGFIDFPNIIYYSHRLLAENPSLARALSCKYAWMLVDEFQDTTELQVEILRRIAKVGNTKFFLVGDPCQSIFGFAGARVELMEKFGDEIGANLGFRLLANYRSSEKIVQHAERVFSRTPPMYAVGETADADIEPVYVHADTAFEAIRDSFLPSLKTLGIEYGEAAIIAPWWVKLWHLGKALREMGVPIVGPGARPYRKSHLFAALAEQVCAFIAYPSRKGLYQIEKELFLLLNPKNAIAFNEPFTRILLSQ